ncbi:MAG: hypothetical protein HY924_11105 [Elusimicrobia bacterium]|nr:hypothetical protein [Elusimicrobiota bacterium]
MTISAHLSPDPERRLRAILESMTRSVERADLKVGALTLFAAGEAAFVFAAAPRGAVSFAALALLGASLPVGALAFSPLAWVPRWLTLLDAAKDRPAPPEGLLAAESLAACTRRELTITLDHYLGGGITATPYYEDIVGLIILNAREAWRKARLFKVSCALVGVGQLAVLLSLLWH